MPRSIESKQAYRRIMNKTEDYIEQKLSESITLKDLAQNVSLSEYHFHRIFKEFSTETVNDFVTRFKLERAAIFLCVNPKISITEITMAYGYNDSSSFSRAFKKHFKISPTKYRKQQEVSRIKNWSM